MVYVFAYLNFILEFKAVLALPKTAHSAQTHESISFIWIVWRTLYVYLWSQGKPELQGTYQLMLWITTASNFLATLLKSNTTWLKSISKVDQLHNLT